jgi:hypothetical protein
MGLAFFSSLSNLSQQSPYIVSDGGMLPEVCSRVQQQVNRLNVMIHDFAPRVQPLSDLLAKLQERPKHSCFM